MKYLLLFVTLLAYQINFYSQTLSGSVKNDMGKPIAYAQILNTTNSTHTHSDDKGNFTISDVKPGDVLEVTHLSYATQQIIIQDLNTHLSIILSEKSIFLDEVVIEPKINALNLITDIDIQIKPVNSSQDILRQVPGLIIGQHAGGGKAEQMFLRGFDIDHGTDIAITVDDLPVNMVSHAHGQGYADLHFVIPETVDKIDFGKGPYYSNKGNFNTAGYVNFKTKKSLDNSSIKIEGGQFNTQRILGLFNIINKIDHHSYIASEYLSTDGPFESSQNFNRLNIFGKYTGNLSENDQLGLTLSHFTSQWDASGQIPQRAVDSGFITRFGAIDDKEGGQTSRTNILINYDKYINENTTLKNHVFYNLYDFELYSNFTFFLEDPINGDEIKQKENRKIYGFNSQLEQLFASDIYDGDWQIGINIRQDHINKDELSHTVNRYQTLGQIQLGDILETNAGIYTNLNFNIGHWTFNPGIRVDYFKFQYNDLLTEVYNTEALTKNIISPKFNVLYNYSKYLQFYLKTGKGFHSNDTRVVIKNTGKDILPAVYGADIGLLWKPSPRLFINTAYWYLFMEQEFVYVGDAGIVEPSGKSQRQGADLSLRYQVLDWLYWNLDTNYTLARAMDEPQGEDYIPLAPDFTLTSGLKAVHSSGIYGNIDLRHIKNRPANEDYSIIAKGYTVVDLNLGYHWKSFDFGISIHNLFDTEWNETQFATESRLQNEAQPIEEIHFTPGTPFFIKGSISYNF